LVRRIEARGLRHQHRPNHGGDALPDHGPRRHVNEDRAEQRQRDADAAEDEILPRRLERFVRAVDADHEHGGQRRDLDRDPHQADIVGHQRKVHGEHQHLIHGVVESHVSRFQPADLDLVRDIARAERAGREAHESGEDDEDLVQVVHEQIGP
jgi:hypothetical protein